MFKFLPGDQVRLVYAQPGYDSYPVEIVSDDGGDTVTIREGSGAYGSGPRIVVRDVSRQRIIWMRGSAVSQRFAKEH